MPDQHTQTCRRDRRRSVVRRTTGVLVSVATVLAASLLAGAAPWTAADARASATTGDEPPVAPRPLFWDAPLADPSVVHDGSRWFAAGTGWRGGTSTSTQEYAGWQPGVPLLDSRPDWARNGDVWAPELVRAPDGGWLAYYAVPVAGLPRPEDRCIGVATSPDLSVPFTPLHSQPLACPADAAAPRASDRVARSRGLPRRGVIDPSSYVAADGRRFLLYRTQGTPSSIRMVRLTASGLRATGRSRELLRDPGVLENPEMVDARGSHHLLLSRGDYGRCGYRTVWRRSDSVRRGWQAAEETVLIDRAGTGICGPGGAAYVPGPPNRLFVHGWVCDGGNAPCEESFSSHDGALRRTHRVIYLARLRWTGRGPVLARFYDGPEYLPPVVPRSG